MNAKPVDTILDEIQNEQLVERYAALKLAIINDLGYSKEFADMVSSFPIILPNYKNMLVDDNFFNQILKICVWNQQVEINLKRAIREEMERQRLLGMRLRQGKPENGADSGKVV